MCDCGRWGALRKKWVTSQNKTKPTNNIFIIRFAALEKQRGTAGLT